MSKMKANLKEETYPKLQDPVMDIIFKGFRGVNRAYQEVRINVLTDWNDREVFLLAIIIFLLISWWLIELSRINFTFGKCNLFKNLKRMIFSFSSSKNSSLIKEAKAHARSLIKKNSKFHKSIPITFWKDKSILKKLEDYSEEELRLNEEGRYSRGIFTTKKRIRDIAKTAAGEFLYSDLYYRKTHSNIVNLEKEIISMLLKLYNSNIGCSGITTSGCSESIMLSVLAHKRYYQSKRTILKPEIILPETAHPSFFKACEFFEITPVVIPVDQKTFKVTGQDYRNRITENTILVVCSSPNLPYGIQDPLREVNIIAGKHKFGFVVDCCQATFLLPFAAQHDIELEEPIFDFRLENITAICCDLSNYGMCPKGISVLMFGRKNIQMALYFSKTNWCGENYNSALISESRSGAIIAASWAILLQQGIGRYNEQAQRIFEESYDFVEEIKDIEGLEIVGTPQFGNIAIISVNPKVEIFRLANYIEKHNWKVVVSSKYPCLHLTILPNNIEQLNKLVGLLKTGVVEVEKNPKGYSKGPATLVHKLGITDEKSRKKITEEMFYEFSKIRNYLTESKPKEKQKDKVKKRKKHH